MLVQIKSLVPILSIATAIYAVVKPTFQTGQAQAQFKHDFITWLVICVSAFALPSIWLFMLFSAAVIAVRVKPESAPALFLILIFAVPPIGAEIPGLGLMKYIIRITPIKLYILAILIPYAYRLSKQKDTQRFGMTFPDKAVIGYLALDLFIYSGFTTVTDNLRTVFLNWLEIIVPYYVFSRLKYNKENFEQLINYYIIIAAIVGFIGTVESLKSWQLFAAVQDSWGITSNQMSYLRREGILRAQSSTGHALILGYSMAIGLSLWLGMRHQYKEKWRGNIILVGIVSGMIASLSRGSWLGACAAIVLHLMLSRQGLKTGIQLLSVIICAAAIIAVTPYGDKLANFLPFIGQADQANVDYRKMLVEYSMKIIMDSPFFGNPYFIQYLEDLRQGQGIIDIVNSYLSIALRCGMVGLSLFSAGYIHTLYKLYRETTQGSNASNMAATLFTTTCAALIMIASVSSIELVPYLYWILLGLGTSLVQRPVAQKSGRSTPVVPSVS